MITLKHNGNFVNNSKTTQRDTSAIRKFFCGKNFEHKLRPEFEGRMFVREWFLRKLRMFV